jgi:hypothetical protein
MNYKIIYNNAGQFAYNIKLFQDRAASGCQFSGPYLRDSRCKAQSLWCRP